jgi:two-component system, LytTR family, sensor histidine kinase AlgZ
MTKGNRTLRAALIVVAGWFLVALAWTPPTIVVQQVALKENVPSLRVFAFVLLGFVPWMCATPGILWLTRRFPLSEGRTVMPLLVQGAAGLVIVPLVTLAGQALAVLFLQNGIIRNGDIFSVLQAAFITSFYSIPTYVAVVAIGQALAYFERYRLRERLLARAELKALQAQINPHFLFNTLNAISALGYKDPALADRALTRLAELLRVTTAAQSQEIPLKDEIAFLRDYTDLQTMLMPDRLDVAFAIDNGAWSAAVPSMILQPLIENAIVHGAAKRNEGGRVEISVIPDGETLVLRVSNDVPAQAEKSGGEGIGLANVRERLRVLYGAAQDFAFERNDAGATATIRIPRRELA